MKQYIALFETDERASTVGVVFPDLPGCISVGDDYEDAVRMAHEALALYADGNDHMPKPRTLEQIKTEWEDWAEWEKGYSFTFGYVALLPIKGQAKRVNVMIDETLLSRIDIVTKNRSAFLAEAARKMLEA